MRLLVVGGTRFVGRAIVATAVQRGHEVTVLHRGTTCAGSPGVEHLHADRDAALPQLGTREWDATIDTCAYWPRQVETLASALGGRGGRHLLISTVSVYDELPQAGFDEAAPLLEPLGVDGARPEVTGETYGRLKVGCEQVAARVHGEDLLVLRPTYLIGPHDHTGRFPAWVVRASLGGQVLVPGRSDAPFQYLDARDLARLGVDLVERRVVGIMHTTAPGITWQVLIDSLVGALSPGGTTLTWVPSEWLVSRAVSPRDLPLWTGSDDPEHVLALDPRRAMAAGLAPRPLVDTITDTAAWLADPAIADPPTRLGVTAEREVQLLRQWDAEQAVS